MAFGYEAITGLNMTEQTDPVFVVRNQIARLQENQNTATAKQINATMLLDVITKAWHARLQGKTPTRFKFGSVGEWPYGSPAQHALPGTEQWASA